MTTKEQLLAYAGLKTRTVEVDGLGPVTLREMTVKERLDSGRRFAALVEGMPDGEEKTVVLSAAVVAASIMNGAGPMFAESEIREGADALLAMSRRDFNALNLAFVELNGDEEELKEAVGKSTEIPSASSSSGSLAISDTPQPAA